MTDSNPVDVCIISRWFYPTLIGPGERFRRYASGLRTRGVHLRVMTSQAPDTLPVELIDGIPVHRFAMDTESKRSSATLLRKTVNHFRQAGQWPDVVQLLSHSVWSAPTIWQTRLTHSTSFVFVSTMMKVEADKTPRLRQRIKEAIYFQLLFRPLNRLVTSSTIMTRNWIERGCSPDSIAIIPNGVDVLRFRPPASPEERNQIRQDLGIAPDDEVILYVGSMSPRKGIDALVMAWSEIARQRPRARLLLVGHRVDQSNPAIPPASQDQAFMDKIDRIISESLAPERIVFTGSVPDVERYMQAADVFAFMSRNEGMPNVIPEAMSCGLPCIITPFNGLPEEFGEPDQEYVLVPRQPGAVATAILTMLENEGLRRKIGRSAHLWVENNLNVETSLDHFAELYRKLATARRRRSPDGVSSHT